MLKKSIEFGSWNTMVISREQIIEYFNSCEIDYEWLWDLEGSRALHMGYWDQGVRNLADALRRQNEQLAARAGITRDDTVLDAGCGVGGTSIYLAARFGCQVTGITITPEQARRAGEFAEREGVADRARFLVRDYTSTGFPAESFSVVWGLESVCYAASKRDFLAEAFRVLRPGGRLIVADGFTTYADEGAITAEDARIMRNWLSGWAINDLENRDRFRQHALDVGFRNLSYSDISREVAPSCRRLYRYALGSLWMGRLLEFLRLRTPVQTGNIIAARDHYRALRRKLWEYGVFFAEK